MYDALPGSGFGTHGSALVAIEDERAALAAVLVLQEMGLTVDIAADHEAALEWAVRARYEVVICGGAQHTRTSEFVVRLRYSAPETRVILLAEPGTTPEGLDDLGVEVLPSPVDVNMLVERLWPQRPRSRVAA